MLESEINKGVVCIVYQQNGSQRKKYKIDNWKQTYSREWAWINQNQSTKYGKSLLHSLEKNGDITENQMNKLREIVGLL